MPETSVKIELEGKVRAIRKKEFKFIEKILKKQVLPETVQEITKDVSDKAREFAIGIYMPTAKVDPRQATHAIGQSESGYKPTGELKESIKVTYSSDTSSTIEADAGRAVYVEFGTGEAAGHAPIETENLMKFQIKNKLIFTHHTLGQAPQPFMRGAVWYIKDNPEKTIEKINKRIEGKFT